ncbi:DUF6414 family protein [Streptomyces sp. NPDC012600]|uniref:DUF6414 family protein n=1 Tax=Streptomyces sp. NPDC012600 TaxID=3415005 RepID=UPI003C2C3EB0
MRLLDYLYLDTMKLSDYMSSVDPGVLKEMRETTKTQQSDEEEAETFLGQVPTDSKKLKSESTRERVLSASEKSSFNRLYDAIGNNLKAYDEDTEINLAEIEKRGLIEVTRDFEPSPLSQMIDSILEFAAMAQNMGAMDDSDETRDAIHGITMLFRGNEATEKEVPVVSSGGEFETSVFFMAHREYILRGTESLDGESTVVGRVEKIVPIGQEVDLFDTLKILPRAMRRGQAGVDLKNSLKDAFRSWPQDLGGPISDDAFTLPGPLVVVSPLAVFR